MYTSQVYEYFYVDGINLFMRTIYKKQNKWYPERCLLAHFEAIFDFSLSEFTCS